MAPGQSVTHLRVCPTLNVTLAAINSRIASECQGPRAVPEGGWEMCNGEAEEGRRLVSVLAPSPRVTMKTLSARGWESIVQP